MTTQPFWQGAPRATLGRLFLGLLLGPLIVIAALTALAFLIAGLSEPDFSGVLAVTRDSAIAITVIVFGFTLSLGMAAILTLRAFGGCGLLAWTIAGLIVGALFSLAFATLFLGTAEWPVYGLLALLGPAVLLLVRIFARIGRGKQGTKAPLADGP